jgi:hypothetical protein
VRAFFRYRCHVVKFPMLLLIPRSEVGAQIFYGGALPKFEARIACMTILLKNGERGGCKIWPSSLDVNHLTETILIKAKFR